MKKLFYTAAAVIITAAAFFFGKYSGANLVRDGIVANYPLFKSLVSNSVVEKDSTISLSANYTDHKTLFSLLNLRESDTINFQIPYHAIYGMDLNSKYFRVSKTRNQIEVYLPNPYVRSLDINFEGVLINGKTTNEKLSLENNNMLKRDLTEIILLPLSKDKSAIKSANTKITEAVIWLFVPYKFELKMYFDNQNFDLPEIVGLNKDVEKYLKENFSNNK